MSKLGIIGLDRQVVQTVAKRLHGAVTDAEHTELRETGRGYSFDLRTTDHRVVRVTVELERVESHLTSDDLEGLLTGARLRLADATDPSYRCELIVMTKPGDPRHPVVLEMDAPRRMLNLRALLEQNPRWRVYAV